MMSTHLIVEAKYRTPTRFARLAHVEQGLLLVNTAIELNEPTPAQTTEIDDILIQRWICPEPEPSISHDLIQGFDASRYPLLFEAFRSTYGPRWRGMYKCHNCKVRFTRGSSQQRHTSASGTCCWREDYDTDDYPTDTEEFKSTERGASRKRRRLA